MLRSLSFLGLAATAVLVATRAAWTSPTDATQQSCPNRIAHEPALIYDVTGGTLLGPVHVHMTVYQDGFATMSSRIEYSSGSEVNVATANASPEEVLGLMRDLYLSGAWELCDPATAVSDVPLTTITVLRGTTDAKSHTFSYWLGDGEYAGAASVVSNFLARHFPSY